MKTLLNVVREVKTEQSFICCCNEENKDIVSMLYGQVDVKLYNNLIINFSSISDYLHNVEERLDYLEELLRGNKK